MKKTALDNLTAQYTDSENENNNTPEGTKTRDEVNLIKFISSIKLTK